MSETDTTIIEAVSTLNGELYNATSREDISLEAGFDGTQSWVKFLGICLWSDDSDERIYDEESDTPEDLEVFLRREAQKLCTTIGGIWTPTNNTPAP